MVTWALNVTEKLPDALRFCDDQGGGDLVHIKTAVLLGHIDSEQPQSAQVAHQLAAHIPVFRFDLMHLGGYFLFRELGGYVSDLLLFWGEVFQRENIFRGQIFDQEAASGHSFRRFRLSFYDHCILP